MLLILEIFKSDNSVALDLDNFFVGFINHHLYTSKLDIETRSTDAVYFSEEYYAHAMPSSGARRMAVQVRQHRMGLR